METGDSRNTYAYLQLILLGGTCILHIIELHLGRLVSMRKNRLTVSIPGVIQDI